MIVAGTDFEVDGSGADVDVSMFTLTGENGDTYTFTSADVEIDSATQFTVTLNATDQSALEAILNKNGTSSEDSTTYNIAGAEDWMTGTDAAETIADLTGNSVTVSGLDETGPVLFLSAPVDDATDVAVDADIVLTFDEPVVAGIGYIYLYNADGFVKSFQAGTAAVQFSGNTVTLVSDSPLNAGTEYWVVVDSDTEILDNTGNGSEVFGSASATNNQPVSFTTTASTFTHVNMCGYVNTNPSIAASYPVGSEITGNSGTNIPFTTCAFGGGGMGTLVMQGTDTLPSNAPQSIEIDVPNVSGQKTVYALLNNYFGTTDANEYTFAVNFTDSTSVSFDAIGGQDTRDFNQNVSTSNSVGNDTTTWWSNYTAGSSAYQRLDVRQFDIAAYSSKTIDSVTLTQVHSKDSAMLSGLTFTLNPMGVLPNGDPVVETNDVTIAGTTNGAEANGATPSQAVFTVTQARISTEPTTVSYGVSGTATIGSDFTALSGSVTIPVGDTSATVTVSILEDLLIEGDETLVLTLTGVISGDLTTQLSTSPSLVTATLDIVDDDFADIAVSNDDLVTTEGRTDDATMGFSLLGQPTGPVILTFAGDDQCTVSPSTMTFTASDFETSQALKISAINDEVVEGTHSCQPTVTVTSADTRFNNFGLTLSAVTVADDLVDQIRNPLKDILQSDFEQTVATQSRQFSQVSKGALGRLQSD